MHKGYDYSRAGNPTRTALETCLAALEEAAHGLAFASGHRRDPTIVHLLSPGDRSRRERRLRRHLPAVLEGLRAEGLRVRVRRLTDLARSSAHLAEQHAARLDRDADEPDAEDRRHRARSPRRAHAAGALLVVDNTFATPVPAAAARRSAPTSSCTRRRSTSAATRTSSAAFAATNDDAIAERLALPAEVDRRGARRRSTANWCCAGVKTLARPHAAPLRERPRRRRRSSRSRPRVERVLYPGLPGHPGHELAARRCATSAG